MKVIYPGYFKDFKCIADKCEDTCCAAWEVVVDTDSAREYRNVSGEFGNRLRREMKTDSDGDIVFTLKNGRCPFLNRCNLCDIYSALGEDALCHTCKMFPRFIEEYGSTRETGLGLACPEAARIIVNSDSRELLSEINGDLPLPNSIDPEEYFNLVSLRKELFLVVDENIDFDKKLLKILSLCGEENSHIPSVNEYVRKLSTLDILTLRWKDILSKPHFDKDYSQNGKELSNILYYYIYRYFLRSVFDSDVLSKARFIVMACVVINSLNNEGDIADIAHLFSKEVEYSAENINLVLKEDFYADF